MPHLISASRRTDIPRFYAPWLRVRRRAGEAVHRSAFGQVGSVSLRRVDVLGYVFWTRDPRPLGDELRRIRAEDTPVACQFTVTAYGPELEPRRLPLEESVRAVRWMADQLPGPHAIQWRYDPIVLSERYPVAFHLERFSWLASRLSSWVRVVNVSVIEPYRQAVARIDDPTVLYRAPAAGRHRWAAQGDARLRFASPTLGSLGEQLATIARRHGLELRSCCDPSLGQPPARCIDPELFADYPVAMRSAIEGLRSAPSRGSCRCLRAVDIGMPNTCGAGCRYCYALTSERSAAANRARHRSDAPGLVDGVRGHHP